MDHYTQPAAAAITETLMQAARSSNVRQALENYVWWWRTYSDPVGAVEFGGDFLSTAGEAEEFANALSLLAR